MRRRERLIAAAVVAAGFVFAILAVILHRLTLSVAISVGSLLVAAAGLYLSYLSDGHSSKLPPLEDAVQRLAALVRIRWQEEAKILGLNDPDPMQVRWELRGRDISDLRHLIFRGRPVLEGDGARVDVLAEWFLERLARRRLVILGAQGSGKSTLAVQLVLRLLEVRTSMDPVPVLLTANSWNPKAFPHFHDWLAARLGQDYPAMRAIARDMPEELVTHGKVLPVIDGLDELAPRQRAALLTTLNAALGAKDPVVLTSRTDEYADAVAEADVLTAAAVIEAQPLTAREAASYLGRCLPPNQCPRWAPVRDELRGFHDTPVGGVCATPLGLWLLRTVYIEKKNDPAPLLDRDRYPDARAIMAHLFEELIPAVIAQKRPARGNPSHPCRLWDPDKTRHWLAYLAVVLGGERDLRWWSLPEAVPTRVTTSVIVAVFGVTVALGVGQAIWLMDGDAGGGLAALILSLAGAVVLGLWSGRKVRRTSMPGHLGRELLFGLATAAAFVMVFVPVVGAMIVLTVVAVEGLHGVTTLAAGETASLELAGVVIGSVVGLVFTLGVGLEVGRQVRGTPEPGYADLRFRNRGRALARDLVGGLVFGLTFGLIVELALDVTGWELALGMALGPAGGLAFGLTKWMRSPGSEEPSRTPTSAYRNSRNLTAIVSLAFGLAFALASGLAIVGIAVPIAGLALWLLVWVAGGLGIWVAVGLAVASTHEPAWFGFVVTSRWLALKGELPWKTMGFLDDAHRLGLLRTTGAVYQFRHADFQDHLAHHPDVPGKVGPSRQVPSVLRGDGGPRGSAA
ncbi:NACHT domain-containing protein [Nocardia sp. NPDC050793]|uniref:NACHT domain-containing protein n=1 Tax=Nocardia sp. NPDC050793 TaxID=3155159 RepID=UPI0033C466EA